MSSSLKDRIREEAAALGFDRCGFARAEAPPPAGFFQQFVAEGRHGSMAWLGRDPDRRAEPRRVMPEARSLIVVALNYWQPAPDCRGRIARYALGDDYHDVMTPRLAALAGRLAAAYGGSHRPYADTGPVLERPHAHQAGIGWQGKSTMVIDRQFGPWLFLGEILTSLEIAPDAPARDHCGSCTRCLTACPTGAIRAPYQMDARLCISYLTIENKGPIPEPLRPLIGDRLYGCDECLEVCPWNRFARASRETRFTSGRLANEGWSLRDLLALTPADFNRRFRGTPLHRIKRRGLLRNACVVLGNIGGPDDLPALRQAVGDPEPLVREHAAWAIQRIQQRQ